MWRLAMKKRESGLKSRLADAAGLPKDVVLGLPILTALGRKELSVENYRGIIEYTDAFIRIQTKCGQIKLRGEGLRIDYYTRSEMKITGKFAAIEYQ